MLPEGGGMSKPSGGGNASFSRTESASSTSIQTTLSSRTMVSNDPPPTIATSGSEHHNHHQKKQRPFFVRNGRTFIADPTLPYPLPVDLAELHRQSLRTLLLIQLFGGPVCSPVFANRPPTRVLEIGCGSGFWSMMCYRYYARDGHTSTQFTGMDIAPIAPGASGQGTTASVAGGDTMSTSSGSATNTAASTMSNETNDGRPDKDMKWRFVQHDIRRMPYPFPDEEFDLIMVKDMSLAITLIMHQDLMDECLRLLMPGGTLEIWESDHTIRLLRPHVPEPTISVTPGASQPPTAAALAAAQAAQAAEHDKGSGSEDEIEAAANLGAYIMTANTPLSMPQNNFLVEYNTWISKALEARGLSAMPCTLVGPNMLQEAETLGNVASRRLAVPLSEVRWEREGVGGVVTKDGKTYVETKGRSRGPAARSRAGKEVAGSRSGSSSAGGASRLGPSQAALRRTALLTVVQMVQGLEPVLREVSGKSQDEWDGWMGKMMNELVNENGTSWGECLEVGAWWARKKK